MPLSSDVAIRDARREDAAIVHQLLERLAESIGKPGGIRGDAADIERFGFGEPRLFRTLIAWQGDAAVGLALFFPEYSSWRGRPGLYVQDLFVVAEWRGTGLGNALLDAVARRARDIGGSYLRLSVDRSNVAARRFYDRTGFRHADEECMFAFELEGSDR
jgi:GNAT superfamily N-acetyltransferase